LLRCWILLWRRMLEVQELLSIGPNRHDMSAAERFSEGLRWHCDVLKQVPELWKLRLRRLLLGHHSNMRAQNLREDLLCRGDVNRVFLFLMSFHDLKQLLLREVSDNLVCEGVHELFLCFLVELLLRLRMRRLLIILAGRCFCWRLWCLFVLFFLLSSWFGMRRLFNWLLSLWRMSLLLRLSWLLLRLSQLLFSRRVLMAGILWRLLLSTAHAILFFN